MRVPKECTYAASSDPLTDTKIKSLKPRPERYRVSDSAGLMLEVMPSGAKIWRYRYQLHGVRHPPLTIGNYPQISLADARKRRDEWAALVARGESPKRAVQAEKTAMLNTVGAFGKSWLDEQLVGKSPNGSLLNAKVEVDSLAGDHGLDQSRKFKGRGRCGERRPATRQPVRRGQPDPHRAQRPGPARRRFHGVDFFPAALTAARSCRDAASRR